MRWGVRDEMTNEHMTTDLCMTELKNCQELSIGPNFIYFGGQKYGYRPIPTKIETSELKLLRETLVKMGADVSLLDKWYLSDTNNVPPISILQPIDTHLVHFLNKKEPAFQAKDAAAWWGIQSKIQELLRKASKALFMNGDFTDEQMHNYFMSVTEREVLNGCINMKNVRDHVIVYTRLINNINLQNVKRASAFIDMIERKVDQEAVDLLANYRDNLARKKMVDSGGIYKKYNVDWIGRDGLNPDTHQAYLTDFVNHFNKNVTKLIDRAMKKENSGGSTKLAYEILYHLHECKRSGEIFFGRDLEIRRMKIYMQGESNNPYVIFGKGGSGKTALLSKVCHLIRDTWFSNVKPILIIRFCGSTPDSNSVILLLNSICQQLSYNFNLNLESVPIELAPLIIFMQDILKRATKEQPIYIILDAIDEITTDPDSASLSWIPSTLPAHCKMIVSCTKDDTIQSESHDYTHHYDVLSKRQANTAQIIELPDLGPKLALEIIYDLMKKNNRSISNYHNRLVLNALENCSLPIFCKLVFAEISRWKSYTNPKDTYLANNVTDCISLLFQKVEEKHGWCLVAHSLAYVTAAKNGITESEIEDLISLDDEVLDDIYQYHLPPTRRIPPLLWTRLRSDLPGYLSDSEADGVIVINWYHRQFREAAKQRYLSQTKEFSYYHSMMSDFFLGTYGGGTPKPFKYTEVQRHRFGLKSKEAEEDRQVPDMPLAFKTNSGEVMRYNLRKLGELTYHLARSGRIEDLFKHCLFNYEWMHAKLCACPLSALLADYEDAAKFVPPEEKKQLRLVADCIRLGGAILSKNPAMLAAQIIGRLLPEQQNNPNIHNLIKQCDKMASETNALVPAYHCLHTPGGSLKFSLEGHQFAVFGFKMTSDFRYIVSISNKFVTFDVATGDLSRTVYPSVEGLMMEMDISPSNKYVVAYTNNSQTILLNTLTNEFKVIKNPFTSETIQGIFMLENNFVIYSQNSWIVYDLNVEEVHSHTDIDTMSILSMNFVNLKHFNTVKWTADSGNPQMKIITKFYGKEFSLKFHTAFCFNKTYTISFVCLDFPKYKISMFELNKKGWEVKRSLIVSDEPLMLSLEPNNSFLISTYATGFKLVSSSGRIEKTLKLPKGIKNIQIKSQKSSECVLSKDESLAISGLRRDLYIWSTKTCELLMEMQAHFGRIVQMMSLTSSGSNCIITSSIDKTIKVWDLDYIDEPVHTTDRHDLPVEQIFVSENLTFVAAKTRNCICIWNTETGKIVKKIADAMLGAVVTHAALTKDGQHLIVAEASCIMIWSLKDFSLILKEFLPDIVQILLYDSDRKCVIVTKQGESPNLRLCIGTRNIPKGDVLYNVEFPILRVKPICFTQDQSWIIGLGTDKMRGTLFVFHTDSGEFLHKVPTKNPSVKDITNLVTVKDKHNMIALLEIDKANIYDLKNRKYLKTILHWNGASTRDGRYGLSAPSRGGLDLLDMKHDGEIVRTLLPRQAQGVFTVHAMFNDTDEYVLYYHSGLKSINLFYVKTGVQIAKYVVQTDLKCITTSKDGRSVFYGTTDGAVTRLLIADPLKKDSYKYIRSSLSRGPK